MIIQWVMKCTVVVGAASIHAPTCSKVVFPEAVNTPSDTVCKVVQPVA